MGFEQYPRISAYIQSKGGVKRGALNKKAYDEGMESWNKLTPEEYEAMKIHAARGGEIVRSILDGVTDEEQIKFAENIGSGLIIIMTKKNMTFQDYVFGAVEQQIIANEAKIPVMCVNPIMKN